MLPFFAPGLDPGPSFVDLLRQLAPHANPHQPGDAATAPFDITHGTTVVAIRYADGVVMAGDRRATAGYTIANRRIEKVFAADDHSGVAIAGAAGPGGRDGPALPGPARALREGRGRAAEPRGQGQPARADGARPTCPPRCRASWSSRSSPATTSAASAAGCSPTTSPAASTKKPTTRPTARAASTPGTGSRPAGSEGMSADDAVALAIRVAVRRRRRGRRHRRTRPRARHLPDGRGHRRATASALLDDDDVAARGPGRCSAGRERGGSRRAES